MKSNKNILTLMGGVLAGSSIFALSNAQAQELKGGTNTSANALEEVVVTAQKRTQNLQDVNAALSAISESRLTNAGIESPQTLDLVTPGLTMTESIIVPQPVMRGITTRNRNPGDESSVPTFVDGIYQPMQYGSFFEYNNIAQIEVLRGPQGTLFGRNATGGAINIVTKKPSHETAGDVSISYASFDEIKTKGYVTTGLSDTVAIDIGFYHLEGGGYYEDLITGESLGDNNGTWSVRSKVLFEPTDNTEVTFVYTYTDYDNGLGWDGQPLNGNTIGGEPIPTRPFYSAVDVPSENNIKQDNAGLTIKHHFDGFYIESLTGYQDSFVDSLVDVDKTTSPILSVDLNIASKSLTQALHLISDDDSNLEWIVGAFYMSDQSGYAPNAFSNGLLIENEVDTTAWSLFAEGTIEFGAGLSLTTGLRYSYEEKEYDAAFFGNPLPVVSDDWSDVSPRVVLGWQMNDSANVYVSYSEAFKSGVYNASSPNLEAADPEELEAFEAGLKLDVADNMRMNFAAFYYDHENLQITTRENDTSSGSVLQNAAVTESYGLEGEFFYAPTSRLNINAGFAYLHSEFKEFKNAVILTPLPGGGNLNAFQDVSGATNTKSPEFSFYVGGSYDWEAFGGNATFATNIAWTDKWFYEPDNRIAQPAHWNVNATVSWAPDSDAYELSLFGSNLTDEEYFSSVISSGAADDARYARPRTIGAKVRFNF